MNASYRKPDDKGVLGHIKEYWFLYAFLGQTIWTFGYASFTMTDHANRIIALENRQETEEVILSEIKSRLSSIDTSIKYIETTLSKL